MADATEIPFGDFAPIGGSSSTIPNDRVVDEGEMKAALSMANQLKGQGVSDADVENFLSKEVSSKPTSTTTPTTRGQKEIPLDQFKPVVAPSFSDVKSGSTTKPVDPSYASRVGERFKQYGEDISNIGGEAYSYVKNYTAEHETHEPGPVTDEEMKAAQQMGIPQFNVGSGGFYHVDDKAIHPTIYKMTPDERQALNDRTLAHIGLDAKGERARAEAFSQAKFDEEADPIANITSKNILSGLVEDMLNPKLAASKQYAAIQQMVTANRIMKNPLAHSQAEVDAAINLKDYYKATTGKSTLENAQDILDEIKENPGTALAKFATQLEADPELGFLGKARLGTLLTEAKLASLSADLKKAQSTADMARRIGAIDKTGMADLAEGRASTITSSERKVADLGEDIKGLKKKEILGNIASEPVIGAAANVALDQAAQMKEKGYVTPGSGATPVAIGAALGTVAAAGEATRLLPGKSNRGPAPPGDAGGDSKRPGGPGEPLPPETPINDKSHVPYAGGVDAVTDIIHYDKSMPKVLPMNNMRGEKINVPVQDLVAYHEAVEKPLMNLKGPMGSDALLELLKRIQGEGTIPKEVMNKLKKGTSLTYPEAHDIATLAENARVRALYGVRPEVYQGALKPYIEQVAKNNKTAPAESIPPTLDKKPYEDMGGEESLKGQGANYEDKASRDKLIQGIKFGSKVVAGAAVGAGVGAALSPDDPKKGAEAGLVLPALSRILRLTKEQETRLEGERAERELTAKNLPTSTDLQHEAQIIQGVKEGNSFYTQILYNHYMPRLVKSMDRWMRDAGPRLAMSGEDIAQEAFLKATQNIGDFKGDSSFYTWLYSIAKNEAKNAGKKSERTPETESMTKPPTEEKTGFFGEPTVEEPSTEAEKSVTTAPSRVPTPEQHVATQQIQEVVQRTINTLPKHHAEVLRLFEIEGKSILEIARDLDRPVGTVLSQAMRGRQALRAAFMGTEMEKLFSKLPPNQRGFVDVDLLKRMAKFAVLAGGGAALGANFLNPDHPFTGMFQGSVLALLAGQTKWGNLYQKFKAGFQAGPDMMAKDALDTFDHMIAHSDQLTAATRFAIDKLVKKADSRIRVAQWVDGDKSITLTPEEQRAAKIYGDVKDNMDKETLRTGTTAGFLYDLIHNMWEDTPERDKALAAVRNAFTKKAGQAPISLIDQMKLIRQLTDLPKGKSLGLKPVVEDANDLVGHYIGAQARAMANKALVDSLKNFVVPGKPDLRLIMAAGKAPQGYVSLQSPQLAKYKAHPSIAPSLEFLHDTHGQGLTLAVESVNMAIKRTDVGFSLFHAANLINAAIGGMEMGSPIRNLVDIAQSIAGKSRGHEAYLNMQPGDDMDHIIRALKITPRKGSLSVEDAKTGFYEGLKVAQQALDEGIPGLGKLTAGNVMKLSKSMDHLLWENVHSGLKLIVAMNSLERLRRSYAKDVAKDPMAHVPTTAELADRASMYTNDIFGGVNWRRMADEATTKYGRGLAYMLANPTGRRLAQVLMFAPDWTYSTVRSWVRANLADAALHPIKGVKGMLNPKEIKDLHRLYILRSALLYATLYNGINFAMSGHMMWENERHGRPEPFMVDLGNGEWMQANKHFMEVPQAVKDPAKWLLGKLGVLPSEAFDQLLHKEYLDPNYTQGSIRTLGPEMKEGRLAHAAKRVLPFNVASFLDQGARGAFFSTIGYPITGKPIEGDALTPPMKQKDWEHVQELQEKKRERQRKRTELLLGGGK